MLQIFLLAILTALTIAVVGSIAWEAGQLRDDLAAYSRIDARAAAFLPESCTMRLCRLYGRRGASAWNFYGAIGEEATPCWRANSKADCHFEKTPPLGSARMVPAETTCSSLPAGVGLPQPSTPARRATSLRPTQVARRLPHVVPVRPT
jgi:hypothetical protein